MSTKKVVRIQRVRLICAALIGNGGEVHQHLGDSVQIDYGPIKILFDDDPRFVRVEGKNFVELIPLTNLSSIKIVTD